MKTLLQIVSVLLLTPGLFMVYGSKYLVTKFELYKKIKESNDFQGEEDILKYKTQQAIMKLKLSGFIALIPAIILILFLFKKS